MAEQQQNGNEGTDLGTVILSSFEQRQHREAQRCASTVPSTSLHKHTVWLSGSEQHGQKAPAIFQNGYLSVEEKKISAGDQLLAPANCGTSSCYSSEKSILEKRGLKTLNLHAKSAFAILAV